MKFFIHAIILFAFLAFNFTSNAQKTASGHIVFGKPARLNEFDVFSCTGQGICRLSSADPSSSNVTIHAISIDDTKNSYIIEIEIDPSKLTAEEKKYFKTTTPYSFDASFTFEDWLMDSLGFKDYKPIVLKKNWIIDVPSKFKEGKMKIVLCGFKARKPIIRLRKKIKGRVLKVKCVDKLVARNSKTQ